MWIPGTEYRMQKTPGALNYLIFDRGAKTICWRKASSLPNGAGKPDYPHAEKCS